MPRVKMIQPLLKPVREAPKEPTDAQWFIGFLLVGPIALAIRYWWRHRLA